MTPPTTPHSLLQQIAQIQHLERGKLCILRHGPQGPYYNHQTWENGKNVSRYVPRDQIPALQQALAGYAQFQQLVEQYARLRIQQFRADRAAGVKKKTSAPNSSWPKNKKSSN